MNESKLIFGHRVDIRTYGSTNKLVDNCTDVGVELELENFSPLNNILSPWWKVDADSSLRGKSAELKFTHPYRGKDIITALELLDKEVSSGEDVPLSSCRTSTHIHMDITTISTLQLYNWLVLYVILERVLYKYAGQQREKSVFCVPFYMADKVLKYLNVLLSTPDKINSVFSSIGSEDLRYSGVNLNALYKFGSLEFRMFPAMYKKEDLLTVINILLSIKKYAVNLISPIEDINIRVSEKGAEYLLYEVFGKYAPILMYDDLHKDILKGIRLSQDIIYSSDTQDVFWNTVIKPHPEAVLVNPEHKNILDKIHNNPGKVAAKPALVAVKPAFILDMDEFIEPEEPEEYDQDQEEEDPDL